MRAFDRLLRRLAAPLATLAMLALLVQPQALPPRLAAGGDTVLSLLAGSALCSATANPSHGSGTDEPTAHCLLCFPAGSALVQVSSATLQAPSIAADRLLSPARNDVDGLVAPWFHQPRAPPAA